MFLFHLRKDRQEREAQERIPEEHPPGDRAEEGHEQGSLGKNTLLSWRTSWSVGVQSEYLKG